MKFESLTPSIRQTKRFKIVFSEPKKIIHFGQRGGNTYIDHQDDLKRENYLKRHMVNEDWSEVNPGSLSAFLLWGKYRAKTKHLEFKPTKLYKLKI